MKTITCIIPAYNEEASIEQTLDAILPSLGDTILEMIVINDCSTDRTKELVQAYKQVTLISNETNLGKSKSVAKAIQQAKGDYIFLLDADLEGINNTAINTLLEPILNNTVDVAMTFLGNSFPLFPFKDIDYCTGQRVLEKRIFLQILSEIEQAKSYELETLINKVIIKENLRIKVIFWKHTFNRLHMNELSFFQAKKRNLKIWKEIYSGAGGFISMYKMNFQLQKLIIKE